MSRITPFLWFDGRAEEAANFYTSIFKNSKIGAISRYGKGAPGPEGSVMTIQFELDGQAFTALNGGPLYKFTEAISFVVHCKDQAEIDYYWERLLGPGERGQCGWLKDKFGLSWQVVPSNIAELLAPKEPGKAPRVMMALMKMTKLDIKGLEEA